MRGNGIDDAAQTPTAEQLKTAAGCGCLGVPFAIFGPIFTNSLGISPWPIPAILLVYAGAACFATERLGNLHRKANMALALALLAFATTSAVMTVRDSAEESSAEKPTGTLAQAPMPRPSVPPPVPARKEEVRIDIDEILRKFARNQIGAAQYFENRIALIPVKVVRVREAIGTGILVTRSPVTGKEIELGFDERGTRQLGSLEPGDNIEATCPEISEAMGEVIIICTGISEREKK